MAIVLVFIVTAYMLYTVERIARFGRSLFRPNFERVDRLFYERKSVTTNWNSPLGKIVYYALLLFSLILFIVFLFLLYDQIAG